MSIGSDRVSIGNDRVSVGSGQFLSGLISQGSGVSFSRFPSCMVRDGIVYASCALIGLGYTFGRNWKLTHRVSFGSQHRDSVRAA